MKSPASKSINYLIYILIIIFPILFISIPRTTTFTSTILAIFCLLFSQKIIENFLSSLEIKIITTAFFSYPIAIILTQIAQNKFTIHEFQQQGRIILLLPLFYYIYIKKLNLDLMAKFCIPLACIIGAFSSLYFFQGAVQWGGRHTVQHIDPLNFGYLMLFLAFSSLIIGVRWTNNKWHQLLCFIAFFVGVYMSIKSGSRTGWLAIPLVILWMLFVMGRLRLYPILIAFACMSIISILLYNTFNNVQVRIDNLTQGVAAYVWTGNPSANYTSAGERISMLRMGWYCFTQAPWFGFGNENLYAVLSTDSIRNYAIEAAIKFASDGFMHNELLTQLVKHGVVGGFAYLFMLSCIIYFLIKLIKLRISSPMIDTFTIYITFAVIASLSTEILVIKPMILFFGFMLACFAGEALWKIQEAKSHASYIERI